MTEVPIMEPLDDLLHAVNDGHGYPALAAAVASSGGITGAATTGVRKAGGHDSVTVEDRFHVGSITKPMTATLLATLVEEGRLRWDAAPTDVLPEFAAALHPALRSVRLEHLLAHRAGIAAFTDDDEMVPVPSFDGSPRDQRLAFAGWLLLQEPSATPISDFLYSNAGYAIATAMAERAANESWEDLMRACLFTPLSLESAGFGWPALLSLDQPWGHYKRGPVLEPQEPDGPYQLGPLLAPAGDVHMTVSDLAEFGRVHLRGLAGEDTLLRAITVRRMHTSLGTAPGGGYGLGWSIAESSHNHTGSGGTFIALLLLRSEQDRVYAVAANVAASQTMEASEDDAGLLTSLVTTLIQRFEGE